MQEDTSNVRSVCGKCTAALTRWWHGKFKELPLEGLTVKAHLETEDGTATENIWIEIDYDNEGVVRGFIVNDPVFIPVKYGDYIQFNRKYILGHISKDYSFQDYDRDCKEVINHEKHAV